MKLRTDLDDFMSIICFKAAIRGIEDILGKEGAAAAMIAAGRQRGRDVAEATQLTNAQPPVEGLADTLNQVFGEAGTKLCTIVGVEKREDGGFLVKTRETVCMSGEESGSDRTCTYTLGAVIGFMEAAFGASYRGEHVNRSTNGSETDDFLLSA